MAYGDGYVQSFGTAGIVPTITITTAAGTANIQGIQHWTTQPPLVDVEVCPDGHETGDEIEFVGGDVYAYCKDCGDRVKVTRIPFDSVSQYVTELLTRFADGDIDGGSLADLVVLRQTLIEEQERILLAMEQLVLAEMLVLKSDE